MIARNRRKENFILSRFYSWDFIKRGIWVLHRCWLVERDIAQRFYIIYDGDLI